MHNRDDLAALAEERRAKQLLADAERARLFAEKAPRRRSRGAGLISAFVVRLGRSVAGP